MPHLWCQYLSVEAEEKLETIDVSTICLQLLTFTQNINQYGGVPTTTAYHSMLKPVECDNALNYDTIPNKIQEWLWMDRRYEY
jgi:hypothetical protein